MDPQQPGPPPDTSSQSSRTGRDRAASLASVPSRLALESSISGVAVTDLHGRLTYVNPALLRMWGFESPDEMLGRQAGEFWADAAAVAEVREALRAAGTWVGEQAAVAARRAADLTRQMLAYSGKASFDVRAMNLNELVEENVHLFRACIPKLVSLNLHVGRDLPAIVADAGQVQQVIMNLLTNAAEAIGDQPGVVTLATGEQEYSTAELYHSRLEDIPLPGPFVYLEVSDSGCGMDGRTLERLFDPFFTTKVMGRGLGMSAILGIVRGHRGAILVESEPGRGSTIRVLFPAGSAPAARAEGTGPALPEDTKITAGAILVVDDEQMVRSVCRRMLEQHGWTVLEADGGPAAIDLFRARADEIACVVLDLSMPQMDGFAVFRALRGIRPDARVILTSGYSRHHEPARDLGAEGFAGFIQKPYSAKALRDEVSRVVAGP